MTKRIGIFGGTFDPIHLGHLVVAEQCREQVGLDQVWFVPAARPPHKPAGELTPFHRRVEMLQLAIAGQPAFVVDELEKDRAGPSYTVDTLEEIHRRSPELNLHFIVGADSLVDLPQWREPARILQRATLLVAARPGWDLRALEQTYRDLELPGSASLHWRIVEAPLIGISSSDLRRRAALGKSLRYLVPRAVECYILQHQLYHQRSD